MFGLDPGFKLWLKWARPRHSADGALPTRRRYAGLKGAVQPREDKATVKVVADERRALAENRTARTINKAAKTRTRQNFVGVTEAFIEVETQHEPPAVRWLMLLRARELPKVPHKFVKTSFGEKPTFNALADTRAEAFKAKTEALFADDEVMQEPPPHPGLYDQVMVREVSRAPPEEPGTPPLARLTRALANAATASAAALKAAAVQQISQIGVAAPESVVEDSGAAAEGDAAPAAAPAPVAEEKMPGTWVRSSARGARYAHAGAACSSARVVQGIDLITGEDVFLAAPKTPPKVADVPMAPLPTREARRRLQVRAWRSAFLYACGLVLIRVRRAPAQEARSFGRRTRDVPVLPAAGEEPFVDNVPVEDAAVASAAATVATAASAVGLVGMGSAGAVVFNPGAVTAADDVINNAVTSAWAMDAALVARGLTRVAASTRRFGAQSRPGELARLEDSFKALLPEAALTPPRAATAAAAAAGERAVQPRRRGGATPSKASPPRSTIDTLRVLRETAIAHTSLDDPLLRAIAAGGSPEASKGAARREAASKREVAHAEHMRRCAVDFALMSEDWGWPGDPEKPRTVEMKGDFSPTVKVCNFDTAALTEMKRLWRSMKDRQPGTTMAQIERFIDRKIPLGPLRSGLFGLVGQPGDIALGFNVRPATPASVAA